MPKADVLGSIVGDMSPVMEHAVEAEQSPSKAPYPPGFDPELHELRDGQPVQRSDGKGFKKKRGRKAGGESKLELPGAEPGSTPSKAGQQIAESIFALGQIIGGEEWAPIYNAKYGIDEREQMYDAWGRYCEAKEIDDMPPGLAVTMVTIAYVAPRFAKPKTKARWEKTKLWVAEKWLKWKGRKGGAQSDPGSDGKRENDAGKSALQEVPK